MQEYSVRGTVCQETVLERQAGLGREDFRNHIKEMGLHYRSNEKPLKGIKQESDEITFSF